jgi:hypothetical protein
MTDIIGSLVFSSIILIIWTIFYRENPFYKAVSSMSVGLMLAFWLKGSLDTLFKDVIKPALIGFKLPRLAVLILGLLIFMRFFEGLEFTSKWPIAILAGVGTAIASKGAVSAMILSQISAGSFLGADLLTNVNNLLIWVGMIATTVYFLFSFERGPVLGTISRLGQIYMMLSFGVVFGMSVYGASVMTQMTFLLDYPGYIATAVAVLIIIADIVLRMQRKAPESTY